MYTAQRCRRSVDVDCCAVVTRPLDHGHNVTSDCQPMSQFALAPTGPEWDLIIVEGLHNTTSVFRTA